MARRSWIKIHCDKWLRGSIRQEPAFVRGIFVDLLGSQSSVCPENRGCYYSDKED